MKTFAEVMQSPLYGIISWERWDQIRARIGADGRAWYVYAVGHGLPPQPFADNALQHALDEIHALLKRDHEEDYLGIVYADDLDQPSLLKIYDPNNLGATCGSSGRVIPPGWVVCTMPPEPIASDTPLPQGRRRWWQGILDHLQTRSH